MRPRTSANRAFGAPKTLGAPDGENDHARLGSAIELTGARQ